MKYLSLIFVAVLFAACGGGAAEGNAEPEMEAKATISTAKMAQGGGVYKRTCIACHMENGMGAPGLNPPLVATDYVLGDKEQLIKIALNGFNGEQLEVNGEIYQGVMTPHSYLSDAELANVLTYVRNSWGNEASEITTEEVAAVRAKNEAEKGS